MLSLLSPSDLSCQLMEKGRRIRRLWERGGEGKGEAGDTQKSWYLDERGGKEFLRVQLLLPTACPARSIPGCSCVFVSEDLCTTNSSCDYWGQMGLMKNRAASSLSCHHLFVPYRFLQSFLLPLCAWISSWTFIWMSQAILLNGIQSPSLFCLKVFFVTKLQN